MSSPPGRDLESRLNWKDKKLLVMQYPYNTRMIFHYVERWRYFTCVQTCIVIGKKPRSKYQYSNTAPTLLGQTSIFGSVFFVSCSLLGNEGQKWHKNGPLPSSSCRLCFKTSLRLIWMKMDLQAEHISTWMVSYEDSFWNRGKRQLGCGLLQFCTECLGAMLEYWYIKRGLFKRK